MRRCLEDFLATEHLVQAQTSGELASKLGVDAAGLERTVRECNSMANNGKDDFVRRLPATFERPFYGIKVTVALYHTQGGLKVNTDGQVLRPNGSVIPNLYAGGGAATGVSGTGVEGYLPGNGLLSSLGLGMLAAEHAVASLKVDVREQLELGPGSTTGLRTRFWNKSLLTSNLKTASILSWQSIFPRICLQSEWTIRTMVDIGD